MIIEVSRKRHFPNNPSTNPSSNNCFLPKSTCPVPNGIKQNSNDFHQNNADIPNDVSKQIIKKILLCVNWRHSRLCKGKKKGLFSETVFPMGLLGHILIATCHMIFPWASLCRLGGSWVSGKVILKQMEDPLGTSHHRALTEIETEMQACRKS